MSLGAAGDPGAATKTPGYYHRRREVVAGLLPPRVGTLLDIGCGAGATSGWLRSSGHCAHAIGVEREPAPAAQARQVLDEVRVGDVTEIELSDLRGRVEAVLCLDVLEHLVDPWAVVGRLADLLEPAGILIATLPTVRSLRVLSPLVLFGRWDYALEGVLDRTHLRFFTLATAREMLEGAGLDVDVARPAPPVRRALAPIRLLQRLPGLGELFASQILLRGRRR
jgi:2-polyprenyl-3-methyl-5-hydroxy-6-metoxy-1,4-benzoquinol methylase